MVNSANPNPVVWWFARALLRERTSDSWLIELIAPSDTLYLFVGGKPLFRLQALVSSRGSFQESLGRVAVQHNGGVWQDKRWRCERREKPNSQQPLPFIGCFLIPLDL